MTSKLSVTTIPVDGGCLLRLSGVIDETFNRRDCQPATGDVVVFDFEGVRRITSYGVKEWITLLKELKARYYAFINCHPAILSQFNMVSNFGGTGQLVTLYAPYLCPACGKETEVLLDLRRQYEQIAAAKPPVVLCPSCGEETEFDDLPESYFFYVSSRPAPSVPPLASRLIEGDFPKPKERLRVRKEIQGNITALWLQGTLDNSARCKRFLDGVEGDVVVVTGGVTEVSEGGMSRFAELGGAQEAHVYFARLSAALASALAAQPEVLGRGQVVSVLLSSQCVSCNRVDTVEADGAFLERIKKKQPPEPSCSYCGGLLAPFSPGLLTVANALVTLAPPKTVTSYLATRAKTLGGELPEEPTSGDSQELRAITPTRSDEVPKRYELLRRIGTGGMAEIYLAKQRGQGGFEKAVVLKQILPNLSAEPSFIDMLLQEARLAARISHPNVVQVFDFGKEQDRYFIAMEYVSGWDLWAVLKMSAAVKRPIPVGLACRIALDLCAGLHAAHSTVDDHKRRLGIVHRDVSPSNILISTDGVVKLSDFGISKARESSGFTASGLLRGKTEYLPPECLRGGVFDARGDIYSAGVVFYECLTGENPFRKDTEPATIEAIINTSLPALVERRPDVPLRIQKIIAKAVARRSEIRYQTAQNFQLDLEEALSELRLPSTTTQFAQWLGALAKDAPAPDDARLRTPPKTTSPEPRTPGPEPKAQSPEVDSKPKSTDRLQEARRRLEEAGRRMEKILDENKPKKPK